MSIQCNIQHVYLLNHRLSSLHIMSPAAVFTFCKSRCEAGLGRHSFIFLRYLICGEKRNLQINCPKLRFLRRFILLKSLYFCSSLIMIQIITLWPENIMLLEMYPDLLNMAGMCGLQISYINTIKFFFSLKIFPFADLTILLLI